MNSGDVLVLKTTGEKVIVLPRIAAQPDDLETVRRATITEDNGIFHAKETFFNFELETLEEHADRQIEEQKLKVLANETLETWIRSRDNVKQEAATNALPLLPKVN